MHRQDGFSDLHHIQMTGARLLLGIASLLWVAPNGAAQFSDTDDRTPAGYVNQLFKVIRGNDADELYAIDWDCQYEREQLLSEQPKFLQAKKLQDHIDRARAGFRDPESREHKFSKYAWLRSLLKFNLKHEIIEVNWRNFNGVDFFDAYVRISFPSPQEAPLSGEGFGFGVQQGEILKELVTSIGFSSTGLFCGGNEVGDTAVAWPDLPLQVVSVGMVADRSDMWITCNTVGQESVAQSSMTIGDYAVPSRNINPTHGPHSVFARVHLDEHFPPDATNIPFRVEISGENGQKDAVEFTMAQFGGNQRYLRSPWCNLSRAHCNGELRSREPGSPGKMNDPAASKRAVQEPAPATGGVSPAGAHAEPATPTTAVPYRIIYGGKEGVNLRAAASLSAPVLAAAFPCDAPLSGLAPPTRSPDGRTWLKVRAEGWVPVRGQRNVFLTETPNGSFRVTWNKPGDSQVSMRSGLGSNFPLVATILHGTEIEGTSTQTAGTIIYVHAAVTGWVVMTGSGGSRFLEPQ